METVLIALVTGAASFLGTWSAQKVHLHYLRRDVDEAHKRITRVENHIFAGG